MSDGGIISKLKNIFLIGVMLLTTCSAFEALASEEKTAEQPKVKRIPLRLTNIPDPKYTDPANKAELAVFKAFRKKYPEIELSAFSGISIQGMADESKMTLAIAGDNAPDVWSYINFRMSDTYIQQSFLYPLDEFLNRDYKGGLPAFMENVPEPIRPVLKREGPAIGDFAEGEHVWGLPTDLAVRVLMWRKDRFQEAGLDPARPPKDWNELLEFSRKLSDPARKRFGMNMTSGKQAAWDFMAFLWSAGGEAVEKNENGEWVAAFDSRKAAEALEFYIRLATEPWVDAEGKTQRGYTVLSSSDVNGDEAWREGRVGMTVQYLDSRTMGGTVDPALVGIAPFPPIREGETSGTELNAIIVGIFAKINGRRNSDGEWCTPEEIREAAWKFISFVYSDEGNRIRAGELVANGMGRSLSPEWLKKYGYWDEYGKYVTGGLAEVFAEAVKNGKPEPYGRNCQLVYFYMTYPIDDIKQEALANNLPEDYEKRVDVIQKRLETASEKTTKEMIRRLTPDERSFRNNVAIIVAILICALFCYALYRIWLIFSPKDSFSGKRRGWEFRKNALGYMIMIPALLSILFWVYYPMISGSQLLFQNYRVAGGSTWTGFDNLADVLFSPDWWRSVYNTLRYMILILGLGFVAPIILAILLQEVSHAKLIYRTLYYLPAVMSGLVVIYMWRLFYQSGPTGILNQVLQSLVDGVNFIIVPIGALFDASFTGITFEPLRWLEDSRWAMIACVIPTVWASAGPGCLIYLAALKGVPDDIYEAAEIDGANFFQKIWHVTLPTLKALIIINFVGAFIGAAQSGGMILIMTFGQANTEVAELHIFKEAYTNLKFGTAIAMAWILGISTLLFTIYQLKKLSNMEFKTTGK